MIADLAVYIVTLISFIVIVVFLRCFVSTTKRLEKEMKPLLHELRYILEDEKVESDSFNIDKP